MDAEYRFQFTEDFLLEAFAHYRRQISWYRWLQLMKGVCALITAVLVGIAIFAKAWGVAAVLASFLILILVAHRIDAWLARRRFRKSPYHNDHVVLRLTERGVEVTGKTTENRLSWATFTKVRRFADGLLLFQGPHVFNWLPDSATDAETIRRAEVLAREHVADYRNV
jgi:hypothetical protein